MENLFKPPEPLVLDGNVAENWKRFSQKFDIFSTATDLESKSEDKKVAVFLNLIGDEGLELFNSFSFENGDEKKLDKIREKFHEYCSPKTNITFERYKFNSICQKEGQNFDNFLTELRKAIKTTQYKDHDDMIRDRIVMGILDKVIQERLLREPKLTLEKAVDVCRATESSKSQSKILRNESQVDAVQKNSDQENNKKPCNFCGYKHGKSGKCPAYGKTCAKCQGRNHFAAVCRKKEVRPERNNKTKEKKVHEVEACSCKVNTEDDDTSDEYFVDGIQSIGSVKANLCWKQEVCVNNQLVEFKLDTGAEVSVLSLNLIEKLKLKDKINKTGVTLVSYGDNKFRIKPQGEILLDCKVGENVAQVLFIVVDTLDQLPLLGLQACVDLKLIKKVASINVNCKSLDNVYFRSLDDIVNKYPSVFNGLGKYPTEHHITLKKDFVPHVQPLRRIPHILRDRLKSKLNELEKQGVICKVDKPTEWVNALVIVEKTNSDLRLCLDPKYLNKAIQREYFSIPTADEIAATLCNREFFTVLDMKDGYLQVKIDEESSDYCTFATPFGRYKYCRLPFGLCSAPEVFQKKNYEIFGDIDGIGLYFDDIIVTGKNEKEHDKNLHLVLERALSYGIKFNRNKIQFKCKSVKFMGQIYSKDGIKLNQNYVEAILKLPRPESKSDLLRILGMAKFLGKFVPNMSKITSSLRDLTKIENEFNWLDIHEKSLNELKHLLTSAPILSFFDPSKNVEIETDASKDGLGACLLQDGHPIAFASRSLSSAEKKYAQIEKEMLAIVFSIQKFHFFVYGLDVKVNTDHKPLEAIFCKDLASITPRLQRMRLRLLNYKLSVSYKPGKYLFIADTLSRAFLLDTGLKSDREFDYVIHCINKYLPMSETRKCQFKNALSNDKDLQLVIKYCENTWPEQKKKVPLNIWKYFHLRDKLFVSDSLLFLDNKIVVPQELRKEMLKLLHEGHFGIEKTKSRARQIFYWPRMTYDIESFIKDCRICETYAKRYQKETLMLYPISSRPWERIGLDIFTFNNQSFLIAFDSFSNWLEVLPIKDKSAKSVILVLRRVFSTHGSPDCVISDNVPFNSCEFKSFAREWNFEVVTRSPNYPRSNGLAERGVGIAKNIIKKSEGKSDGLDIALLQYRNSPLKYIDYSPAQLLMSRNCKTKLPSNNEFLKPKLCQNVYEKLQERQNCYKKYYNRQAKDLKPICPNADINVYNHVKKKWEPGQVICEHSTPRSYLIKDSENNVVRRNRIDLKESTNKFVPNVPPLYECSTSNSNLKNVEQPAELVEGLPEADLEIELDKCPSITKQLIPKTRSGRVVRKPQKLDL